MDINPVEYFRKAGLQISDGNGSERKAKCLWHADKVASLSVNIENGLWWCHSCRIGGNIVQFHARANNCSTSEAYKDLIKDYEKDNFISENIINTYHKNLITNTQMTTLLFTRRGLNQDIIKKFKLGLHNNRIAIPIYQFGLCVNIRLYSFDDKRNKYLSYGKGYGEARIFPFDNLKHNKILLTEGEMDCLLANQLGFNAITITGGAGTWKANFTNALENKELTICYDIDKAGKEGAQNIVKKVRGKVKSVKVVVLPIADPPNADFTDYIIKHEFTADDFQKLTEDTSYIDQEEEPKDIHSVTLVDSSNADLYDKYISVDVLVSGKDIAPYSVPKIVKVKCNFNTKFKKCVSCIMALAGTGDKEFLIRKDDMNILKYVDSNDLQVVGFLRQKLGLNCKDNNVDIIERQNVEEIRVIPEINYNSKLDNEYIVRQFYYMGYKLRTNKSYKMIGKAIVNPKNQYVTVLVQKALATQLSLDNVQIGENIKKQLKIFQTGKKSVSSKLKEIHDDLSRNITHIYHRNDLLTAIDLVYHSVLRFTFGTEFVQKGWGEALILGDTRCGKSKTIEAIVGHYKAGEIVSGENISFAGLVGGMQQVEKRWSLNWGKIPLNDKGSVAIDEMSSLNIKDIANMSGIRSKGVAEITKIQQAKTNARTRLICLSNPRTGRKLNTYSKGVLAIKELIGKVEDVARFDLFLTLAEQEVKPEQINTMDHPNIQHKYTSDLCHALVVWAWTRQPENIIFEKGVESAIMQQALLLSEQYDSTIPLIVPAEQRIKLAKLAIAVACRLFSTDAEGENVVVKMEHAEFVYEFIQQCLNKNSCGYDTYSEIQNRAYREVLKDKERVTSELRQLSSYRRLREVLLEYEVIRKSELELQMNYDASQTKAFFSWASERHLIRGTQRGYIKNPAFIIILKSMREE